VDSLLYTPVTTTEADGEILSYASQTIEWGEVQGSKYAFTLPAGSAVTLQAANPSQTAGNDKGSSNCGSIGDACTRAWEKYEDDRVYDEYTAYTASLKGSILNAFTFGQAGCTAIFECDDYGFGMTGAQIKDA
jgi:hypothetical protein